MGAGGERVERDWRVGSGSGCLQLVYDERSVLTWDMELNAAPVIDRTSHYCDVQQVGKAATTQPIMANAKTPLKDIAGATSCCAATVCCWSSENMQIRMRDQVFRSGDREVVTVGI
jgi:hypothetical protein